MASVRKVEYYTMKVSQRPGAGAALLGAMKKARVNLLAFTGFPTGGGAQVDFVPQNGARFRKAAKAAGLRISGRKTVFFAQGADRVGALTGILGKLAQARINLVSLSAVTAGRGRFGMLFWVRKADVGRASRVLRTR
jgi:predicted amino acid-binding ACT domain protein